MVAVLFLDGEHIRTYMVNCYGDTRVAGVLKCAREANSWTASAIFTMHGTTSIRVKATSANGMISWRIASSKWYVLIKYEFLVFNSGFWVFSVGCNWCWTWLFIFLTANSLIAFPDSEQIFVHGSWILRPNSLSVCKDGKT